VQIRLLESTNPHPNVAQLAGLLRILAEENRLRILCLLLQGEHCVAELCQALDLPQNLVSHHLGVLREAGLLIARRDPEDSRWVYYSVNTPQPQAFLNNPEVYRLILARQLAVLPITTVNGKVIKTGAYPSLAEVRAALNGVGQAET